MVGPVRGPRATRRDSGRAGPPRRHPGHAPPRDRTARPRRASGPPGGGRGSWLARRAWRRCGTSRAGARDRSGECSTFSRAVRVSTGTRPRPRPSDWPARCGLPYLFGYPGRTAAAFGELVRGRAERALQHAGPGLPGLLPGRLRRRTARRCARSRSCSASLQAHVESLPGGGLPLLVVFVCHPERLCYSGPLEQWQYGNGVNHGRAKRPTGRRPAPLARGSRARAGQFSDGHSLSAGRTRV